MHENGRAARSLSWGVFFLLVGSVGCSQLTGARRPDGSPNLVLILCDDHRADAMGFVGHPFLETPHMDRMARDGVYFKNAFVTTSLCSPSRASILTGLYAHNHGVIDNYHPVREDLVFFPELLQSAGYETAFIGKWHMGGDHDDPQRGFDHWLAFKGQGTYWPDGRGTTRVVPQTRYDGFNLNGERVPQRGYITDELTDYALEWLDGRSTEKPFFLYVSHKAVHSDFVAADRHRGRYASESLVLPDEYRAEPPPEANRPAWLRNQRNSRHGVDFGYNLDGFDVEAYYRRYCESLLAVDDGLGRIIDRLAERGMLENTIVVYMGDNGFQFGEHGLIDKRVAYETSIRVPLIMLAPDRLKAGTVVDEVVANIDVAPTLLAAAGIRPDVSMDGRSFWPIAATGAPEEPWRDVLLYEYYWEWNYPQTPTIHAVRGERYKFIRYHGVWDTDELYDLEEDPLEIRNLIRSPEHAAIARRMKTRLFEVLEESGGRSIPLLPDRGRQFYYRHPERTPQAQFPPFFYDRPAPVTR